MHEFIELIVRTLAAQLGPRSVLPLGPLLCTHCAPRIVPAQHRAAGSCRSVHGHTSCPAWMHACVQIEVEKVAAAQALEERAAAAAEAGLPPPK